MAVSFGKPVGAGELLAAAQGDYQALADALHDRVAALAATTRKA